MFTTKQTRSEIYGPEGSRLPLLRTNRGSALIVALVIMLAVAIIGMVSLQMSTHEIRNAASDRNHKEAFYGADGTLELVSELLEQNIESITGFEQESFPAVAEGQAPLDTEVLEKFPVEITIVNSNFWINDIIEATKPSSTNNDFYLIDNATIGNQRTNFKLGGRAVTGLGGAIQMAAGYEGRGKSKAQGGGHLVYEIISQHTGRNDSEAIVRIEWRHVN
jgi:Tfp pilus assembly protein PilX